MDRVKAKVAVVTGGASGIGRATAKLLAAEGAAVAIGDVNEPGGLDAVREIEAAGGQALFVRTDVSSAAAAEALVQEAVSRWGALHILHNNAYAMAGGNTVVTLAEADWDRTLAVCLKGMYLMARAAIPAMLRSGGGAIVNMASAVGLMGTWRNPAYAAAKGGVIALTKSIAIDFGRQGIRCNCIAPGSIATGANVDRWDDPEWLAATLGRQLLDRLGKPEDVAAAVLYLASDESAHVTGTTLSVDAGVSTTPNWGRPPWERA